MGGDATPRAVRRREVGWPVRVELAEDDLDSFERSIKDLVGKLDTIEDRQRQILIALATGAMLLLANIAVMLMIGGQL